MNTNTKLYRRGIYLTQDLMGSSKMLCKWSMMFLLFLWKYQKILKPLPGHYMATSDINQNKCINVNKFHLVLLVHPCRKAPVYALTVLLLNLQFRWYKLHSEWRFGIKPKCNLNPFRPDTSVHGNRLIGYFQFV